VKTLHSLAPFIRSLRIIRNLPEDKKQINSMFAKASESMSASSGTRTPAVFPGRAARPQRVASSSNTRPCRSRLTTLLFVFVARRPLEVGGDVAGHRSVKRRRQTTDFVRYFDSKPSRSICNRSTPKWELW
jgi:hypothetical protein